MADKPTNELTGLCGEHYVAALLAGHGLVVALPRGGAARADLFVADSKRGVALRVQVKSGRQSRFQYKRKYDGQVQYSWRADYSIVKSHDKGLWFAFVSLGDWPRKGDAPVVFFVPSDFVAERLKPQESNTQSFFWGFESELSRYCGEDGVTRLKAALVTMSKL